MEYFIFRRQSSRKVQSMCVAGTSILRITLTVQVTYMPALPRAGGDVIAYYSSDERLKDNIRSIDSVLDKVCQIRSIEFEWNDNQEEYEGTDVGVSAQSVQVSSRVLSKSVSKIDAGVRYEKLVGPAIGAIAELRDISHSSG